MGYRPPRPICSDSARREADPAWRLVFRTLLLPEIAKQLMVVAVNAQK